MTSIVQEKLRWPLMKETILLSDRLRMAWFALSTKKFTGGAEVEKFENEWSEWLGCKHSLFVSSGSTANFLLLAAVKEHYNLPEGSKVLVPACTWVTNVSPVFQLGLTPIFCDINITNFGFCEQSLELVAQKHPDIRCIFVSHLLGFSASPTPLLQKLFPDALIIDDVCESHGTIDHNSPDDDPVKVGADSLGATFSFYFGHHMTTIEGGMVSTNNSELYDLMKMKRSHGFSRVSENSKMFADLNSDIDPAFLFATDGYNFRNHEICAVLGRSQLKRLDSMIERRRENYHLYCSIVERFFELFYLEPIENPITNSSFCFPLVCNSKRIKQVLKGAFADYGIETRPIVSGNLLRQPFLKKKVQSGEYELISAHRNPIVDLVHDNGLYIGNNHFIKDSDMEWLADEVLDRVHTIIEANFPGLGHLL